MKKTFLLTALTLAASSAPAAQIYQTYKCVATHGAQNTNPFPDAPQFDLECILGAGGVSGQNFQCDLNIRTYFPVQQHLKQKLTTLSYEDGKAVLEGEDATHVEVDIRLQEAHINVDDSLFTECHGENPGSSK